MNCKKYLLGLVTMGLVTACTDLDPEIYSNLTTTNAYSTESDIEAAVVGLYSDMNPYPGDAWLYYGGYMIMITDYATDIGYSTAAGDPTKLSNMTYDASNRYFSNNWRDMYNVVSNANTILDNVDAVNMSEEKFTQYALNPNKAPDKAHAFEVALGYTLDNYKDLMANISDNFDSRKLEEKGDDGYGMRYQQVMNLNGPNGKTANVCTAWIQEKNETSVKLTSAYVTKKEVSK